MQVAYWRTLKLFTILTLASLIGGASCAADAKYSLQAGAMDFIESSMSEALQTAFPIQDMINDALHPG